MERDSLVSGAKPIKVYQIIFSFLEPSQAVATFPGNTPEEAISKLKEQLKDQVSAVEIDEIQELYEIPDGALKQEKEPEPEFDTLPENVIVFPGNQTRN